MRYLLLIMSAVLVVTSCTKKEDASQSREAVLREGKWRIDTMMIHAKWKADNVTIFENIDKVEGVPRPECLLDDQLDFRELNDGAHIPGENTCSINETAELQFRWGLYNNDEDIYIYDAKELFKADVNADLVEFYDDKFVIEYPEYKDKKVTLTGGGAAWVRDTTIHIIHFRKI